MEYLPSISTISRYEIPKFQIISIHGCKQARPFEEQVLRVTHYASKT